MAAHSLVFAVALIFALAAGAVPAAAGGKRFSGLASYYSKDYHGRTASGQRYDPRKFTAAHRTLPLGTRLRVTRDGRSVIVVVNDRGPFLKRRVLDLSFAAARALHIVGRGLAKVSAEVERSN
jgi:peptidoglycan lytic transglycosylase